jgi:hypothetical protein
MFVRWVAALYILFVAAVVPAVAQDPNECDEPGDFPDVIVGDLQGIERWGAVGDITGFSVATYSCNIGTCWLNWISSTNEHPVIAQNLYRLKDGRFEQIGQSWLKHGFFALSDELCDTGCISTDGSHLGVNCADPYSAGLNGTQGRLGPRSEVNPYTGEFPYPFGTLGQEGDAIYKRLQVHDADLDPALNAGAQYFVEGHYIASDDAAVGNADNNASYREVFVTGFPGNFNLDLTGDTMRRSPAIGAWSVLDATAKGGNIKVSGDGQFNLYSKATDLGGGMWSYEYAIHNLNVNRAAGAFRVPIPAGAQITNIGFHDVDYHSGEPYDGTDWTSAVVTNTNPNEVVWTTEPHSVNPNANALRWGTLYNFRFDANVAPIYSGVTIDLFLPGTPAGASGSAFIPTACNNNGICEVGETCTNCAADCVNVVPGTGFCGDGVCDPTSGEDCLSCAGDCNGDQSGPMSARFCCGDGDGSNPVGCNDSRCTTGGFSCGPTGTEACCGDSVCEAGAEDPCNCAADCGPAPAFELICDDGLDDDCDGLTDCLDLDCCTDLSCADGIDNDNDGVAECDCDDNNDQTWGTPGAADELRLDPDGSGGTTLQWLEPGATGATSVVYDVLRSGSTSDFESMTVCVPSADPSSTVRTDADTPGPSEVFNYLVRAVNDCPGGDGPLGTDSEGAPRTGRSCP